MKDIYIYSDWLGSEKRLIHKGVSQGGVLSPLLYILYVRKIMHNVPKEVQVSQFADDIEVHSKDKKLLETEINVIRKN